MEKNNIKPGAHKYTAFKMEMGRQVGFRPQRLINLSAV
jgi:hypothetical protein